MSIALQIAMFVASVAIVIFVAFFIPTVIALRKQAERTAKTIEELKAELDRLMVDSRQLLQKATEISTRVDHQWDEVGHVIHTVRAWSDRANRIVEEVGDAIEPPIFTMAHDFTALRQGLSVFLRTFFDRNQHTQPKQEKNHDN